MATYVRELIKSTPYSYSANNDYIKSALLSPMHVHSELEILMIQSGNLFIKTADGNAFSLSKGDFVIFNGNFPHETLGEKECVFSMLRFSLDIYMKKFRISSTDEKYMYNVADYRVYKKNEVPTKELLTYFDLFTKYYKNPDRADYCHGTIEMIIGFLKKDNFITRKYDAEEKNLVKILPVISFIHNNFTLNLSLEELAAEFNYNSNYLGKIFKNVTKKTIVEYINFIRLEEAKILLATTKKSITTISLDVGFSSPSYFIKLFKNQYSYTPNDYRNANAIIQITH